MTSFDWALRVYYEDTDAGGVVYFANYLRFMERARTEWLRQLGFDQHRLRQTHHIVFVVRSVEATYLLPARLDDALVVRSRVVSSNRVALRFEQSVERDDQRLVESRSDVVCVDAERFKPCRIPQPILSALLNEP